MILSSRYRDALGYAFDLHCEQQRKGSQIPYLGHVLGVSSLVLENGGNEDEAIAGLLHDAVEDQGGLEVLHKIRARFGPKVAEIVAGCSDSHEEPKPPWRERKERYIEHLRHAPREVQLVSACDKLYNAGTIVADYQQVGDDLWLRFNAGRNGVLWYYRAVLNAFTLEAPIVDRLRITVEELERLVVVGRSNAHR